MHPQSQCPCLKPSLYPLQLPPHQSSLMLQVLLIDQVRIMTALVLQAFLCYPLRSITNLKLRQLYSITISTLLQTMVFGLGAFKILAFCLVIYGIVRARPQASGGIVTLLAMAYLSYYHLHAILYRYGEQTMDEIVLLMIAVCKCSLFAYAYSDGHNKNQAKVQKQGKIVNNSNHITEDVSIVQYLGYLQFLPTSVMGPPTEYQLYRQFMQSEGVFSGVLPCRRAILLKTLKQMVVCCVFFALGMTVFSGKYMKTQEFLHINVFSFCLYIAISMTLIRFKYYSAWKIGILSVHASGVSYDPQNNDYTGIDHCKPSIIETTPHIRLKINNWNIMVQQWLRKCVYERSPFRNRFVSQLYVFMVSAFWHGYYPGYYLSFLFWFAQVYLQGQIFKLFSKDETKLVHKLYKKLKSAGPVLLAVLSSLLFNLNSVFFYVMQSGQCFEIMKKMLFLPQVLPFVAIIVLNSMGGGKKRSEKQS